MADNSTILEKLDGLVARFEEISTLITDPAVIADQKRYVKLTKEYKELDDLMKARKEYIQLLGNIDGAKNIEVHNAKLISKDAFWNCENVIVYDSTIIGEYLAWNSKNITFINCTIESLQGLCYMDNVKMVNCKLINTSLAFEYCSNIDADIVSHIDSITNQIFGIIRAHSIGEIILDEKKINPQDTKIMITNQIVGESYHCDYVNC